MVNVKALYSGDVLFVIAMAGSRMAVSLLLSSSKCQILIARMITILRLAWVIAAVLAVAVRPDLTQPWKLRPTYADETVRAYPSDIH